MYDPSDRWTDARSALAAYVGAAARLVDGEAVEVLIRLAADEQPAPVVALVDDEAAALAALAAGADDALTRAEATADDASARIARAAIRRRVTQTRLARRAAEVGAANATLEAFGRSVSHDLRAPLRALHGFGEALLDDFGETLDPMALRYLERMAAATDRLDDHLSALLTLTEAVRRPFEREQVDLGALADDIVEALREDAAHEVSWSRDPDLVVSGDRRLLEQLLQALLENAWRFSSTRPVAHVELRRWGPAFVVRDDGVGFGQAYGENIFHAFSRFHGPDEFPGRGMGLTVARCVTDRHGGRIMARGVEGAGAAVAFTLDPADTLPALDALELLPAATP